MSRLVNKSKAKPFHPEYNTKPNVYYIGLDKMAGYSIAGNVALKDTDECAEKVKVTLESERIGEEKIGKSDFFGKFEFDG